MATPDAGIFRQEALEFRLQHAGRRAADVLFPRLMARPVVVALWISLLVLIVGGLLACLPTVPVTASGLAVTAAGDGEHAGVQRVALLIPEVSHEQLEPGSTATIAFGGQAQGMEGTLVAVESEPLAPSEVGELMDVPLPAMSMLSGSVTVAWVEVDATNPNDMPAGTLGQAEIEVGRTPAGSFLPLVGRFFED